MRIKRQYVVWHDGGVVSRYDGKSFKNYTTAQGLADNLVPAITEDKNGNIWFGTGRGLCQLDRDGKSFQMIQPSRDLERQCKLHVAG
jgi:ligand-binding sensor domain-containing protein